MKYSIEGAPLPVVICNLDAGESVICQSGAMSSSCRMDVQEVPGLKNALFGGEGIFNTVVTGPGNVWLQSLPISQIVKNLTPFLPKENSN